MSNAPISTPRIHLHVAKTTRPRSGTLDRTVEETEVLVKDIKCRRTLSDLEVDDWIEAEGFLTDGPSTKETESDAAIDAAATPAWLSFKINKPWTYIGSDGYEQPEVDYLEVEIGNKVIRWLARGGTDFYASSCTIPSRQAKVSQGVQTGNKWPYVQEVIDLTEESDEESDNEEDVPGPAPRKRAWMSVSASPEIGSDSSPESDDCDSNDGSDTDSDDGHGDNEPKSRLTLMVSNQVDAGLRREMYREDIVAKDGTIEEGFFLWLRVVRTDEEMFGSLYHRRQPQYDKYLFV
ncbi:hypothetical protein BGX23_008295 [Mortierella sp. AD031]|nr:hypothetical protein BGX23_008295 [Mortierella sp. AD031]